jgi:hypothetical protein
MWTFGVSVLDEGRPPSMIFGFLARTREIKAVAVVTIMDYLGELKLPDPPATDGSAFPPR